jgi:hypothetical protein
VETTSRSVWSCADACSSASLAVLPNSHDDDLPISLHVCRGVAERAAVLGDGCEDHLAVRLQVYRSMSQGMATALHGCEHDLTVCPQRGRGVPQGVPIAPHRCESLSSVLPDALTGAARVAHEAARSLSAAASAQGPTRRPSTTSLDNRNFRAYGHYLRSALARHAPRLGSLYFLRAFPLPRRDRRHIIHIIHSIAHMRMWRGARARAAVVRG